MNADRRKALGVIRDGLKELNNQLEALSTDERDYVDNMPDNLQGSAKYETAEEGATKLEEATEMLEQAAELIEEAIG